VSGEYVVLGAGSAGLAAAVTLAGEGAAVTVLERAGQVGGLCRTLQFGDYRFDLGGHRIISDSAAALELIRGLCGPDLAEQERRTKIVFGDHWFRQPLQMGELLRRLDKGLMLRCGLSFLRHRLGAAFLPAAEVTFEQWVVHRFGRRLYDIFFGPYTRKVWGVEPSCIDAEWAAQRIQVPGLLEVARHSLGRAAGRPPVLAERYLYPHGGIGLICDHMSRRVVAEGGRVLVDARPLRLRWSGRRIEAVQWRTSDGEMDVAASGVVSTIPLPELVRILDPPPPPAVREAAAELDFRALTFLFLTIDRDWVMDQDALYVPDPRYLFFRVEQPKMWSAAMAPPERTSLCLEISCRRDDAYWRAEAGDLLPRAVADLQALGLLRSADEVLSCHKVQEPHAYPAALVGVREKRRLVVDWLDRFENLRPAGRQGFFRYVNQDAAIEMGVLAAGGLLGRAWRRPEEVAAGNRHLWQVAEPENPVKPDRPVVSYPRLLRRVVDRPGSGPVYLIHFVTQRCNLRCSHCFLDATAGGPVELDAAAVATLAPTLGPDLYAVMLTGGEPLLRADLSDIVDAYMCLTPARCVRISTNGLLGDEAVALAESILSRHPKRVLGFTVSIDGPEAVHDAIRGRRGALRTALATCDRLRRLAAGRDNLDLAVNITASRLNQDQLTDTLHWLGDRLPGVNTLFNVVRGRPRRAEAGDLDPARYRELFRAWRARLVSGGPGFGRLDVAGLISAQNVVTRRVILGLLQGRGRPLPCRAGSLSGVLWPDGRVTACELRPLLMGRVQDHGMDLARLWRSQEARAARRWVARSRCSCTHECFLICNILFNPTLWPRLLIEGLRVCRARRLKGVNRRGG